MYEYKNECLPLAMDKISEAIKPIYISNLYFKYTAKLFNINLTFNYKKIVQVFLPEKGLKCDY